jgi:hypothetical protein
MRDRRIEEQKTGHGRSARFQVSPPLVRSLRLYRTCGDEDGERHARRSPDRRPKRLNLAGFLGGLLPSPEQSARIRAIASNPSDIETIERAQNALDFWQRVAGSVLGF